ncbi:hypothetical protein [Streptomyces sp. RPT161]|uniref:hypothetical protein n=1 Tax=Streptomyces sp. RPT161 TaxID=3015993 RepID=UPI0022B8F09E|nr:hypothetical protein [Streptomyces sp. RPT161]
MAAAAVLRCGVAHAGQKDWERQRASPAPANPGHSAEVHNVAVRSPAEIGTLSSPVVRHEAAALPDAEALQFGQPCQTG